jgi:hypothetical protein
VGNTRYRGTHAIYVSRKEDILCRIVRPDPGRELATEFMTRHGFALSERLVPRPIRGLRAGVRAAWLGMVQKLRRRQAARTEQMEA